MKEHLLELFGCIAPNGSIEIVHGGTAIILSLRMLLSMAGVLFFQTQDLTTDLICNKMF